MAESRESSLMHWQFLK